MTTMTDRLEAQRLRLIAIHEAQQAAKVREALEKWSSRWTQIQ